MSKTCGVRSRKLESLFCDGSHLDKTMPDDEKIGHEFYTPSVNARFDYSASGIRWRRIADVNRTNEIISLPR